VRWRALGRLDSYQLSFAQNAQNIFDFFVNPRQLGVHKEINFNQLFETCMAPACPGWEVFHAG